MPAEEMYCHVSLGALKVTQSYQFRAMGLPRPNVKGSGYLAGEFPGGTTTVDGVPSSATVRVLFRPSGGRPGDGYVIAETISAPDGTWHIDGINSNLKYDVVGRKEGFNDVIVSNVTPTSMVEITYTGEVLPNGTFTGATGHLELVGGIPPYTASVVEPLPAGLFPVVNGRQLIIDGTTTDDDVFNSTVLVTSSNGATETVPINLVVGFKAPANLDAESLEDAGAFSVLLTWEVTNTTQEVLVFKSATPFDLESMPAPIATLTGVAVSYTDDDVIEDDVFYYMTASVHESYTLYSDEVREVVGPADPHWDNVVSLLHFDGSLTENEAGSDFTVYGAPTLVQGKFGEAIFADFNYGVLSQHSDFMFGTEDFTIECFWKPLGTNRTVFSFNTSGGSGHTVWQSGTGLSFWNGSGNAIASSQVATSDIYHHIAFVRSANVSYLFLDGVLVGSAPYSTNLTGDGIRTGNLNNVNPAGGAVDEFRVTKGVARYTANFTPPTKPFPDK